MNPLDKIVILDQMEELLCKLKEQQFLLQL